MLFPLPDPVAINIEPLQSIEFTVPDAPNMALAVADAVHVTPVSVLLAITLPPVPPARNIPKPAEYVTALPAVENTGRLRPDHELPLSVLIASVLPRLMPPDEPAAIHTLPFHAAALHCV